MALTQVGGTVFNVVSGSAPGGIDLNVSGTLLHATGSSDTGLVKTGSGTMVLGGANTYTGGTIINAGTVSISADNNLGNNSGSVTLNGGTLVTTSTNAMSFGHVLTIGGNGVGLNIVGNGAGATGQADRFILATALQGGGAFTVSGDGTLAGTAPNTTTAGAGALVLNAGGSYTGTVTLQNGGLIEYAAGGAIAASATIVLGNESEFTIANGLESANNIIVNGGTNSVISFNNSSTGNNNGAITLNATATVGLRDWYNYATVRGGTLSGVISGSGGLIVNSGTGSGGVLTLSAANTFTGNITVNSSVLDAGFDNNVNGPSNGALGNPKTAGRTVTINSGSSVVMMVGNVLGTGSQTTAPALSFIVNQGGLLKTAAADVSAGGNGDANIFGNITLNGGTMTAGNGANASYQSVILLGTVTSAGTVASTINTNATNTTANGVMLGASGGVNFNVGKTGVAGADLLVSASLVGAAGGATGSLIKSGLGNMQLSASNTYTGTTTVNSGILSVASSGAITASSSILVGNTNGVGGAMYQGGGTVTNTSTAGGGFQVGSAVGASGYYNLSSGTLNVGGEIDPGGIGGGAGTFGQFDMNGGTLNLPNIAGSYILPDRGGAGETSVTNFLGGTVQIAGGGTPTNGSFNGLAVGISNVGNLTSTITVGGTAQFLTPSLTMKLNDTNFGSAPNSTNVSVLNLDGGTLQTLGFGVAANQSNVALGNGFAVINFNGGLLKAGVAGNTTFLSGLGGVYVYSGGGTINNNGQAITIAQAISSPTGMGVSGVSASGGSGYVAPPQVGFSGGGGSGASGYATINSISGAVTGIVVTNPGTGYSGAPTVTLTPSGGGSGAIVGTASMATNAAGALVFQGLGTTTLSGVSAFSGNATVSGGTVNLTGSIASANITVTSGVLSMPAARGIMVYQAV